MRRGLLFAFAAVVLAAVMVVGLSQAGRDQGPEPSAGRTALSKAAVLSPLTDSPKPLASLHRRAGTLLPGGTTTLTREIQRLRGYPVVVNLWAAWCAPCRREMPLLQRVARERGREIAFLGVNVLDNREAARKLFAEFFVPYPSVEDPRGLVRQSFGGGNGLPGTAFYTADGKLEFYKQGEYGSTAELTDDIRQYAETNRPR